MQASALRKDDIEFRRKLWLEKLDAYKSVDAVAGRLISTPPGPERVKSEQGFSSAYWGAMILVEDKAVENAMVETGAWTGLHRYETGPTLPCPEADLGD